MQRFLRGAFVVSEDLSFYAFEGSYVIEGRIMCEGGIEIEVKKRLMILSPPDELDPLVRTEYYIYNATIPSLGPIFRYNSPHADHNRYHHVHRYEVLDGDTQGTVELDYDDDAWPTLAEVISETEDWYHRNVGRMTEQGLI
jgi:hypothetical protein